MELPKPAGSPRADVLARLRFLSEQRLWPNGGRHLFTDAFGVVVLTSLYRETGETRWLREAEWVADAVERATGGAFALDAHSYHHLALWLYALHRLGAIDPRRQRRAVSLAREIHPDFVGRGCETALDPFLGYVIYRLVDHDALRDEIAELGRMVEGTYDDVVLRQDLALGSMLWLTHFFPDEPWARVQQPRALDMLDRLWVDPPGYFCRLPGYDAIKYAFTNYAIAIGLLAVDERPERRWLLQEFFRYYRSGDHYDRDPLTHVLFCAAALPGEMLSLST